jgi:hypothetical protein
MPKKCQNYICELCDFICSKKSNYYAHLTTNKHINRTNNIKIEHIKTENIYFCKKCNKEYNARNSLWYHEQKCNKDNTISNEKDDKQDIIICNTDNVEKNMTLLTNLIVEVVKNNNEFQKQILDLVKNSSTNISNSNINSNNQNTFNLQLFLNETCKDAMNMSEFINSFNLQMSDLERLADDGYVKTMSNLIVNKVRELDVEKRPIHCSDAKREVIYIKENDVWIKDDENKSHLRKAINKVGSKNIGVLQDWQAAHPNYYKSTSPHNDTYLKMLKEVVGGKDTRGNENKVIKNIIKEVVIDKQQFLTK